MTTAVITRVRREAGCNPIDGRAQSSESSHVFDPAAWWQGQRPGCEGCAVGLILHGSASTKEVIRRASQGRQERVRASAKRYGVSATTILELPRFCDLAEQRFG